jgi:hypothetical protein
VNAAAPVVVRTIPRGGVPAWSVPDPAVPPVARLDAGLRVQVLEQRQEGWARVQCGNGWAAWVDGRSLQTDTSEAAKRNPVVGLLLPAKTGPVSLIGAAAAILGGFLPWFSAGGVDVSAWDISIVALIRGSGTSDGLKAGAVLLVVALIALPLLTHRPLPGVAILALAGVANNIALLAWLENRRGEFHADIGFGLILTFVGGSAIFVDYLMPPTGGATP